MLEFSRHESRSVCSQNSASISSTASTRKASLGEHELHDGEHPAYITLDGDVNWTWINDDEHWITVFSATPPGFDASSPSKFDADAAAPIREQEGVAHQC
jgi:hypothetical protein